jgi:hypothetical protein
MRHDERYHDDEDDAPIAGGSTEQRDAQLADKAALRAAQDADYRARYEAAERALRQPAEELLAWATSMTEGRVWSHRDAYLGYLSRERRTLLGRALLMSEYQALNRVGQQLWAERASGIRAGAVA